MKIRLTKRFRDKLDKQIDYIAKDKPSAARIFKEEIILRIRGITTMPYRNRKSIFFDNTEIREFIYKGYVVVYKIDKPKDTIEVFGFTKYETKPF
ncbi:MAG: type II toxin-antitoxin system RelE/ParE family toxin [Bacteroidales bacterium]|jgi:plasmid stabilization system protein ParE|nr:type II toxin-antitoxin system RelE/ParE family toxin [Bacteroidales bacterium]